MRRSSSSRTRTRSSRCGEAAGRRGDYKEVLISAIQEVGRPSFFSLLVIALSFLPIFALEAQEGKLFKPLAFTKNFSMAIAALLAITLDPALRLLFTRMKRTKRFRPRWLAGVTNAVVVGRMVPEEKHPISRVLFRVYGPPAHWVLRHTRIVIAAALLVVLVTIPVYFRLGHEFMPPLNEGVILYMPTTLPGISVTGRVRCCRSRMRCCVRCRRSSASSEKRDAPTRRPIRRRCR